MSSWRDPSAGRSAASHCRLRSVRAGTERPQAPYSPPLTWSDSHNFVYTEATSMGTQSDQGQMYAAWLAGKDRSGSGRRPGFGRLQRRRDGPPSPPQTLCSAPAGRAMRNRGAEVEHVLGWQGRGEGATRAPRRGGYVHRADYVSPRADRVHDLQGAGTITAGRGRMPRDVGKSH